VGPVLLLATLRDGAARLLRVRSCSIRLNADQEIPELVLDNLVARFDDGRAVELLENRRSFEHGLERQLLTGIDRRLPPGRLAADEAAIAEAMPKARAVFGELARLLGDQPYLTGDSLSLADLIVASHVTFFTMTPEWAELGAPLHNLAAWLARMEARSSMQATTWERVNEMAKAA
jgi:glutathione S-transferase